MLWYKKYFLAFTVKIYYSREENANAQCQSIYTHREYLVKNALRKGGGFMSFEQMRYFISLAQTLSFTETARRTFTTQPTVSRQIKMLETELGQPLFYRRGSSIALTPTGQLLYEKLVEAYQLIEEGMNLAKANVEGYRGSLYVASAVSLDLDPFMVACYKQFASVYPMVEFHFVKTSVPELHAGVMEHRFDLIVCHDFSTGAMNQMERQKLFDYEGCLVYSRDMPIAQKVALSPSDFSGMSIICLDSESSVRGIEGIKKIAHQIQLKYKSIITVPNLETVFFYVHAGLGVAILDTSVKEIYHKVFATIPICLESARVVACAAWDGGNANPAIAPFVRILRERATAIAPPGNLYQ